MVTAKKLYVLKIVQNAQLQTNVIGVAMNSLSMNQDNVLHAVQVVQDVKMQKYVTTVSKVTI